MRLRERIGRVALLPLIAGVVVGPLAGLDVPTPARSSSSLELRVRPRVLMIAPGGSASATVAAWFGDGFTSTKADLSAGGLPRGLSLSFAPDPLTHQGMAVLTLRADRALAPGTYPLQVSVSAEGLMMTRSMRVRVSTSPGFVLDMHPAARSVSAGGVARYRVAWERVNGFHQPVRLSVRGLPSTARVRFLPAAAEDAAVRIRTTTATPPGRYRLTVTGRGAERSAAATLRVLGGASSWNVSEVGTVGAAINTVLVGPGRDDGVNRLYAGTVTTGRIWEFSWDGDGWSDGVDIGGSPGGEEIHNMGMGPGRDDGIVRLYACSRDERLYELTFEGPGWQQETVGTPGGDCTHALVGDGRNDGRQRVYASRGPEVWEYTWRRRTQSWREVRVGTVDAGIAHGIALGRGRGGGGEHLYVASTASGSYEATFRRGRWRMIRLGDDGDVRNISVGRGRDDGVMRVYAGTLNEIREFTWRDGRWRRDTIATSTGMIHVYVVRARNDPVERLYAAGANGHAFEFTWNGRRWVSRDMGGAAEYLYGFHHGARPGGSRERLYGGSFDGSVYEFTWRA